MDRMKSDHQKNNSFSDFTCFCCAVKHDDVGKIFLYLDLILIFLINEQDSWFKNWKIAVFVSTICLTCLSSLLV